MPDTLPSHRKGQRVIGPARDAMTGQAKEMYAAGNDIRLIAEHLGRSYGFVHRILTEAAVEFRSRGGNHRSKSEPAAPNPQFSEASESR
jgi:hypothetical protein